MTDMQRYDVNDDGFQIADERGPFVLAADAEAAIAAAVEDFRAAMSEGTWYQSGLENGYEQGQRDMLAKCIAALTAQAATGTSRCDGDECHEWADAIRTLLDLQEKP